MDDPEVEGAEFQNFLRRKYAEFVDRAVSKGRPIPSQNEFAIWLGVKNSSLSLWINGYRDPAGDSVHKLATKLGLEVYDILGQPRSMPHDKRLLYIATHWQDLDESDRKHLHEVTKNLLDEKSFGKDERRSTNNSNSPRTAAT